MDPSQTPEQHPQNMQGVNTQDTPQFMPHHQPQAVHSYPQAPRRGGMMSGWLSRTTSAFAAEYSTFLIALFLTLSNLGILVYIFFDLIVTAMHGGAMTSYIAVQYFALWLGISSLITIGVTAITWSRTQGELANNEHFKGELPRGGAAGFRTFMLVLGGLTIMSMVTAAIFAPILAASAGSGVPEALLAVTAPSLIGAVIAGVGMYVVTRKPQQRSTSRMILWVIVGVTTALFITDYIWAHNTNTITPTGTTPTYTSPADNLPSTDNSLYNSSSDSSTQPYSY